MECKIERFNSLEVIETCIFKELPSVNLKATKVEKDNIDSILRVNLHEVIYVDDEYSISKTVGYSSYDAYSLIQNTSFSKGDLIAISDNKVTRIDKDLATDTKFCDEIRVKLKDLEIYGTAKNDILEEYSNIDKNDMLNKEVVEKSYEIVKVKAEKEQEERKKEEKYTEEKEVLTMKQLRKKYNDTGVGKEGIFEKRNLYVKGKEIKNEGHYTITLNKDVNKLVPFDAWEKELAYGYGFSGLKMEELLIRLKIPYKITKETYSGKKEYSVKYNDKDVPTIKGVTIPPSKREFLLDRIDDTYDENKIKLLKSASLIKIKTSNLKEIRVSRGGYSSNYDTLKVPIEIDFVDDKHFKIKINKKEKTVTWDYLKDKLCSGRTTWNQLYSSAFMEFMRELGFEKKETLDYLKRVEMLQKLEGEEK